MNSNLESLVDQIRHNIPDLEYNIEDGLNITTDVKDWLDLIKKPTVSQQEYHLNFDYEVINNATLFALEPVVTINSKVELMTQNTYDSLEDVKRYLDGKKYVLYKLLTHIKTGVVDTEKFEIKKLDTPKLIYIFRGFIL